MDHISINNYPGAYIEHIPIFAGGPCMGFALRSSPLFNSAKKNLVGYMSEK